MEGGGTVPDSKAQVRLAHAVLEGKSKKLPRDVAEEIVNKASAKVMRRLPERK